MYKILLKVKKPIDAELNLMNLSSINLIEKTEKKNYKYSSYLQK